MPNTRYCALITGGAGFIGSSLAEAWLHRDPQVFLVLVDNLRTGSKKNLPDFARDRWRFLKVDVNRYEEIAPVFFRFQPRIVVHCAALVGVERTLAHPLEVLQDTRGIEHIARLSALTQVERLFYTSSSEVYGEPVQLPLHEEDTPLNARLPYAVVKVYGETVFRTYQEEYGLPVTIFRLFNTYGPRQSPDFVISRFLQAALRGEPITIYGDGKQTRTFCYIDDVVEFFFRCLETPETQNQVYNVGSDQEITILQLAKTIRRLTQSTSPIVFLPPRARGEISHRRPDNRKMRHLLGRPLTPLEEGIRKILQIWNHVPQRQQRETPAIPRQ